jgi:hypothetical protein
MRALLVALAVAVATIAGTSAMADARSRQRPPLEKRTGLRPGLQLAAMRTAIAAAPRTWEGYDSRCVRATPVIAFVEGSVMAGNFRDEDSNCYVWLNLAFSPLLNAQQICKLGLHELGHLSGLAHSDDPDDVMYSPFTPKPIPAACRYPLRRPD